jgi:hypothetical protein
MWACSWGWRRSIVVSEIQSRAWSLSVIANDCPFGACAQRSRRRSVSKTYNFVALQRVPRNEAGMAYAVLGFQERSANARPLTISKILALAPSLRTPQHELNHLDAVHFEEVPAAAARDRQLPLGAVARGVHLHQATDGATQYRYPLDSVHDDDGSPGQAVEFDSDTPMAAATVAQSELVMLLVQSPARSWLL